MTGLALLFLAFGVGEFFTYKFLTYIHPVSSGGGGVGAEQDCL